MTHPTVGDMIARYHEFKAYVEAEQAKLDEVLKPYKDAMRTLQTACGVALQEQGLQNFKSEDGTAYLRHDVGVKVDNKSEFLSFVRSTENWNMLDVRALKEPVQEYAASNQDQAPPGIVFDPSVICIIRR
jgi:hypothetical protein